MALLEEIARAVDLRQRGQHTEALAILLDLQKHAADDATVQYQLASTYDVEGLESDALACYERALILGLEGGDKRAALLGLGSTYRNVEQFADAVRTLERGMAEFPDAAEFAVFLALALHDIGEHARAMQLLVHHIAAHTGDKATARYQRALFQYADSQLADQ